VAYYDHRHSGIYGTNILQVIKQAEGDTIPVTVGADPVVVVHEDDAAIPVTARAFIVFVHEDDASIPVTARAVPVAVLPEDDVAIHQNCWSCSRICCS
jgi:hypothetical protein